MKRSFLLFALALFGLASPAFAHEYEVGSLVLTHPWTRATPPGAEVAAAYVKIANTGDVPDRLIGVSSPTAEAGELHEMKMDGDVMQMRKLEGGIEIAPGATVELKPGSFHGMLTKLKESFVKDAAVKATFTFEKAGAVEVELVVEAMGASEGSHNGHE